VVGDFPKILARHHKFGGMWWLREGCGGSVEGCGGSVEGCGGSVRDVVAQMRDVVAQLVKATGRHQTEDAAVPGSNPAPPTVT
jgi:hypothetical protein